MAFGTGSHPTTQLCLAAIDEFLKPGDSVGDLGTGSGILAIAAKLLGAGTVEGSDIDPLAVKIAQDNAEVNGVEINFTIDAPTGEYDLVVANILADVILDLKDLLIKMTKPTGVLVVSGIIDTRSGDVLRGLCDAGLELIEERAQSEWRAIIFRVQQSNSKMTRFFVQPEQIAGNDVTLDADDAHHLRVCCTRLSARLSPCWTGLAMSTRLC